MTKSIASKKNGLRKRQKQYPWSVVSVYLFEGCQPSTLRARRFSEKRLRSIWKDVGNPDRADLLRALENQVASIYAMKVATAGYTAVGQFVKIYDNWAMTIVIPIEESAICFYTRPEVGKAELVIHYCNHKKNNAKKSAAILKAFIKEFRPRKVRHLVKKDIE